MLSAKKTMTLDRVRDYQRELEYLYARKCAIDSLIESLEEYQRSTVVRPANGQRRSA